MSGTWIKTSVLALAMSVAGCALQAQMATQSTTNSASSVQSGSATDNGGKLQLTPDQKKQLHALRMTARDKSAIIRNDQTLTAEQKQSKLKDLHASTREQMKSILTPEQQKTIAEHRAARQAKFAAKLGLTADQQAKLKDLFRSSREQRTAVLSNTSLTNDQKLAQLQQIREDRKAQLATILTPDQLQQLRQLRRSHRHMHKG
jgi:Spy/CpxP family protein refolding chaperone